MESHEIKMGDVLRKLRKITPHSQESVAHLCDVERKTITNLEQSVHIPNLVTFGKYAVALNMRPSELLKEIEEDSNFLQVITSEVEARR